MTDLSHQERKERIARDGGDPNDTVWRAGSQGAYHEDRDCTRLSATKSKEATRKEAQKRFCYPCGFCVLGEFKEGSSNRSPRRETELTVPDELSDSDVASKLVWLQLAINGALSTAELIDQTKLSRSSVDRGVNTLRERGLVNSMPDPTDARRQQHRLVSPP
ncbi:MarR family transcriptional regulator [Haloferax sp. Atlit-12N]|uniref:MarR family transcriptional regulator n=1 Tax=unclassified Haloferax TaxID=2625095 RepID=UPI000E22F936|nr:MULTISPECIES: helix-turn-helix domain-containing protein [unclassified Haloferax]RDZ61419.1 MarR family transcriptional regulator [Haloferax sp. Atlit-12N]REA00231.1 MarR family transcriptional regulator [Haloferax sp. Atlit-6N]